VKSQDMDVRSGPSGCQQASRAGASNEAAFMDERKSKDQRPRCFRTEAAADQERDEPEAGRETASNFGGGPPRWTPSGVSCRVRLRRQRGGIPRSTSTAGVPTDGHLAPPHRTAGGRSGAESGRFVAKRGQPGRMGCVSPPHDARSHCGGPIRAQQGETHGSRHCHRGGRTVHPRQLRRGVVAHRL